MLTEFKEAEFEDVLIQNLQALSIKAAGKLLYVCPLEGNRINFDSPEDTIYLSQYPCCAVGIVGIPVAMPEDNQYKSYNMQFDLVCLIATYDTKRKVGQISDIRELLHSIRQELYRRNPYKSGNRPVMLSFVSEEQVAIINDVVIYEQRYTGKYFETID